MHYKKIVRFDMKAVSDKGDFEGYGAIFDNIDLGGDIIEQGAFKETLAIHAERKEMPAMLWSHNSDFPIGDYIEMREDDRGLFVKGILWVEGNSRGAAPVPEAERARNMMMGTGPKGLSIGYNVLDSAGETVDEERIRVLKKLDLWEVSPTVFAMNPKANVLNAKGLDGFSIRSIERSLRDIGLSKQEAKSLLANGFDGMYREDTADSMRDAELAKLLQGELSENKLIKDLIT